MFLCWSRPYIYISRNEFGFRIGSGFGMACIKIKIKKMDSVKSIQFKISSLHILHNRNFSWIIELKSSMIKVWLIYETNYKISFKFCLVFTNSVQVRLVYKLSQTQADLFTANTEPFVSVLANSQPFTSHHIEIW